MNPASSKEAVVFIHSTGTGPLLWSGVEPVLVGERSRVFAANLGYTAADRVERGRTVTAVDDANHVLSQIPAEARRVHLVAHSYGALVALHAARALGDRVASLFFYEPVLFGLLRGRPDVEPAAEEEGRTFMNHPWFLTDFERGGTEPWLEMFIDYWNRPGSWSKMPAPLRELSLAAGWKMFQEVRACFLDELTIDAATAAVPSTIVRGDRTTAASRAMSKAICGELKQGTFVELAGLGHMAPLTQPQRVHEELAKHLGRLVPS